MFGSKKKQEAYDQFARYLKNNDFSISRRELISGKNELFIDEAHKKWLIRIDPLATTATIYKFSDLIDFEILQDGTNVSKTTSKGKISSSGRIKGKAKTDEQEICKSLSVRICVNDLSYPEMVIPFITFSTKTDSFIYKSELDSVRKFTALLTYIQSNSDSDETKVTDGCESYQESEHIDDLDQIEKLHSLMEKGIITKEDFEAKKKQLLGI